MLPGTISDYPAFLAAYLGPGLVAAFVLIALAQRYWWPVLASAAFVVAAVMAHANGTIVSALQLIFHVTCWTTLFVFFERQLHWPEANEGAAVSRRAAMIAGGASVFLCLMSFGPVYISNDHPLASTMTRALLVLLPPLEAIREFD